MVFQFSKMFLTVQTKFLNFSDANFKGADTKRLALRICPSKGVCVCVCVCVWGGGV